MLLVDSPSIIPHQFHEYNSAGSDSMSWSKLTENLSAVCANQEAELICSWCAAGAPHTASPCCSSCDCTEGQLLLRYSSEYTNRGLKKAKKTDIVSHGICVLYKTGFSLNMLSIRGRKFFYQRLGTRKMSKLHLWVSWVIKLTEHSIPHSYSNSWKHLSGTLFKQWCLNLFKRNALITPLFSVSSFFFFFLSYSIGGRWFRGQTYHLKIFHLGGFGSC